MDEEERAKLLRRVARQLGDSMPFVQNDHFMRCAVCGQFFDLRDFTEVYYHYDGPHTPMKAKA